MRIELISEDVYSFAEVISEYETSVLTVKLRGRTLNGGVWKKLQNYIRYTSYLKDLRF